MTSVLRGSNSVNQELPRKLPGTRQKEPGAFDLRRFDVGEIPVRRKHSPTVALSSVLRAETRSRGPVDLVTCPGCGSDHVRVEERAPAHSATDDGWQLSMCFTCEDGCRFVKVVEQIGRRCFTWYEGIESHPGMRKKAFGVEDDDDSTSRGVLLISDQQAARLSEQLVITTKHGEHVGEFWPNEVAR